MRVLDGADRVAAGLEEIGIKHVFGLPGSQNSPLFDALRETTVRAILSGSELSATFMANGYWRAGGGLAAVAAIPGPGFAWAMAGIAEAARDDAAFILLTGDASPRQGRQFDLQGLDQPALARGLARRYLRISAPAEIEMVLQEARHAATAMGPGPVVVELARGLLDADTQPVMKTRWRVPSPAEPDPLSIQGISETLRQARRPLLIAGQGALDSAKTILDLVHRFSIPVLTTVSGRGLIPESDPFSLQHEFLACRLDEVNRLIDSSDFVLILGCRTSHNGTGGYGLRIPEDCSAHVDLDPGVPGANYRVRWPIVASTERFLGTLVAALGSRSGASTWTPASCAAARHALRDASDKSPGEPSFPGHLTRTAAEFFATLQAEIPNDAVVVTDTGSHQILARRYLRIEAPRGLIVPADFQSMGFGIPAAIGAAIASPDRRVVAIVGDGSMTMVGLELATAVRNRLAMVAIVFNDGHLGQIWTQQIHSEGRDSSTALAPIDFEALSAAVGCNYRRVDDACIAVIADVPSDGVTLVEVLLGEPAEFRALRWKGRTRQVTKQHMPRGIITALRRLRP